MPTRNNAVVLCACAAFAMGCESFTEVLGPTRYTATLNGASVKPTSVSTSATGRFTAALHPTNGKLSYTITWSGLSGAVIGAEINGPADANGIAGILVDLAAVPNGVLERDPTDSGSGELDLTLPVTPTVNGDSLKKLLGNGRLYVSLRTSANQSGEIRGQILPD